MTLKEEALKAVEDVPMGSLPMLIEFAHMLRNMHDKEINAQKKKRDKPRLLGALKGKVWMSDDFNDPMDFVSEDEMRVLEVMRSAKQAEIQENKIQEAAV